MGIRQALTFRRNHRVGLCTLALLFASSMIFVSALAAAQEQVSPAQPPAQTPAQSEGFLATFSRWFGEQTANVGSSLKDARKKVEGFSSAAGDAAKTTVDGAKDAAGAVVRIPAARAVSGHETCQLAPNGAPDCVAAARTMCKAKGFDSGKSLDMTTAEVCPPKVYMSGLSTGPECTTETFVSRALCQ